MSDNCKCVPHRDLEWSELKTSIAKIERLRTIIRKQHYLLENMTKCLNELMEHQHSSDGTLVRQIKHPYDLGNRFVCQKIDHLL